MTERLFDTRLQPKVAQTVSVRAKCGLIISTKEVMFLPDFVCLSVCLSVCLCVSKITHKVLDGSFGNFEGMSGMAKNYK